MDKCKDCKYFSEEVSPGAFVDDSELEEFFECTRIGMVLGENHEPAAAVVDGSGYFAALRVREDFSCSEFVKR